MEQKRCDGWRDDRCDEREEGTGDEERQMDHHGVTLQCVFLCAPFSDAVHIKI